MRPIDADAAKNKAIICTNAVIFGDESEEMITFARTVLDLLLMALDDAPTIVVEPVRHGKWEEEDAESAYFGAIVSCSKCGAMLDPRKAPIYHFCYNCGAKMDGEP